MIERLEKAIEKVKCLPRDRQAFAAVLLEEIASESVFIVPDDHRADVLEAREEVLRGERATDEEMAQLWKKGGL
jgi:DNA-directed RNA polymerase